MCVGAKKKREEKLARVGAECEKKGLIWSVVGVDIY